MKHALLAAIAALLGGCGGEPAGAAGAAPALRTVDFAALCDAIAHRAGKPLLVNFWATWCAPCVAELPDFAAVAKDFEQRGGEAIAVSMDLMVRGTRADDVRAMLPGFLKDRGLDVDVLLYDDDPVRPQELDVPGTLPSTLAVDANGKTVAIHEGSATRAEFEALARRAAGR